MVITITKKSKPGEIDKALMNISKLRKRKSVKDFYGALRKKIDGLDFQRKVRDEWE